MTTKAVAATTLCPAWLGDLLFTQTPIKRSSLPYLLFPITNSKFS